MVVVRNEGSEFLALSLAKLAPFLISTSSGSTIKCPPEQVLVLQENDKTADSPSTNSACNYWRDSVTTANCVLWVNPLAEIPKDFLDQLPTNNTTAPRQKSSSEVDIQNKVMDSPAFSTFLYWQEPIEAVEIPDYLISEKQK